MRGATMKTITAEEFDQKFDDGEDISAYVDWSKGFHPNRVLCPMTMELPQWLVNSLDERANTLPCNVFVSHNSRAAHHRSSF